jgi:hypothetical protein
MHTPLHAAVAPALLRTGAPMRPRAGASAPRDAPPRHWYASPRAPRAPRSPSSCTPFSPTPFPAHQRQTGFLCGAPCGTARAWPARRPVGRRGQRPTAQARAARTAHTMALQTPRSTCWLLNDFFADKVRAPPRCPRARAAPSAHPRSARTRPATAAARPAPPRQAMAQHAPGHPQQPPCPPFLPAHPLPSYFPYPIPPLAEEPHLPFGDAITPLGDAITIQIVCNHSANRLHSLSKSPRNLPAISSNLRTYPPRPEPPARGLGSPPSHREGGAAERPLQQTRQIKNSPRCGGEEGSPPVRGELRIYRRTRPLHPGPISNYPPSPL